MFIGRIFVFALKQIHVVSPKLKSVQYHDWGWGFGLYSGLFHVLKKSRKLISNNSTVRGKKSVQINFKLRAK